MDRLSLRVLMLKRVEQFLAANPEVEFEREVDMWEAFVWWYMKGKGDE